MPDKWEEVAKIQRAIEILELRRDRLRGHQSGLAAFLGSEIERLKDRHAVAYILARIEDEDAAGRRENADWWRDILSRSKIGQ